MIFYRQTESEFNVSFARKKLPSSQTNSRSYIDITKRNYFVDLIKLIHSKSTKADTIVAPVPLPNDVDEEKQKKEGEEEASLKRYKELSAKNKSGTLNYNESALLTFFNKKFGKF